MHIGLDMEKKINDEISSSVSINRTFKSLQK